MAESNAPASGDMEAIAKRVEELNRRLDAANSAVAKQKTISIAMTFVIVIVAVIGVVMIFLPIKEAYDNQEAYATALQEVFSDRLQPELEALVQDEELAETAQEVGDLVFQKLQERQDEAYGKVSAEVEDFVTVMQAWGENEYETRKNRMTEYIEVKLKEEVPVLEDPENQEEILANLHDALNNIVDKVMMEHLRPHIEHVNSIDRQLREYPIPDDILNMDDLELMDALTNELGVYAMEVLRNNLDPETRRALIQSLGEEE